MNTNIHRGHPVHALLDAAAAGHQPTPADLDRLLVETSNELLPAGQTLNRFRDDITRHTRRIAAIHATGATGQARTAAAEAAAELAGRMSAEQRSLTHADTTSSRQAVEDAVARAFNN